MFERQPAASEAKAIPKGTNSSTDASANAAMEALERLVADLQRDLPRLGADLRDSGFGPFALNRAKGLYDAFVKAVDATRKSASADQAWLAVHRLAASLAASGSVAAASEIADGLLKRAARHPPSESCLAELRADADLWSDGGAAPGAAPSPKIDAIRTPAPRPARSANRKLAFAALGLVAALVAVVGGNFALLNFANRPGEATGEPSLASLDVDTSKNPPTASGAPSGPAGDSAANGIKDVPPNKPAATAQPTSPPNPTRSDLAAVGPATDYHMPPPRPNPANERDGRPPAANAGEPAFASPVPPSKDQPSNELAPKDLAVANEFERLDPGFALRVQRRLVALGFLTGEADGVWGRRSREALITFKRTRGLAGDRLDEETRDALFPEARAASAAPAAPRADGVAPSSGPPIDLALDDPDGDLPPTDAPVPADAAPARGAIVGAWAQGPAPCFLPPGPGRDVLWIGPERLVGEGRACRILEARQAGSDWYVLADCGGEPASMRFSVNGERMRNWANAGAEYRRCEPAATSVATAEAPPPVVPGSFDPYAGPQPPPPVTVGPAPRFWRGRDRVLIPPRDIGPGGPVADRETIILVPGR